MANDRLDRAWRFRRGPAGLRDVDVTVPALPTVSEVWLRLLDSYGWDSAETLKDRSR